MSQVSICSSSRQSISVDESGLFNLRIQAIAKQPNMLLIEGSEKGIDPGTLNQEQSPSINSVKANKVVPVAFSTRQEDNSFDSN